MKILNKRMIDGLKWRGLPLDIILDDSLRGFGIRVYSSGLKTFVLSYRYKGRKHIRKIGQYGVLTIDQARTEASRRLLMKDQGMNPFPEKERRPMANTTFEALCKDYLERHASKKKSGKQDENRIKRELLPLWGKREVAVITSADVSGLHHKTTMRGAKTEANRLVVLAHTLFSKAIEYGYLARGHENPATGITPNRETKRDRYVKTDELPRLAAAIEKNPSVHIRAALWLYLLTGMRKNELLKLRWADIDVTRREIRLENTKAGRVHYVPLSGKALSFLEDLPKLVGNPHLFPGAKPGTHLVNITRQWYSVRKEARLEDVRLHDLRRTTGSWLAQSGNSLHLIGGVLNHSSVKQTASYSHHSPENKMEAMEGLAENLFKVSKQKPEPAKGEKAVIPITRTKAGE